MREVNIVKLYVPYVMLPGDDHVFWCHSCQMGHSVLSVTLATGSGARYLHYCQLEHIGMVQMYIYDRVCVCRRVVARRGSWVKYLRLLFVKNVIGWFCYEMWSEL